MGALLTVLACLPGCGEYRPPAPEWCIDLRAWLSSTYELGPKVESATTPDTAHALIDELQRHEEPIAEYPELSRAYATIIEAVREAGVTGSSADSVAATEAMWDVFDEIEEPCPGPYM